jgi:hypothetical protein
MVSLNVAELGAPTWLQPAEPSGERSTLYPVAPEAGLHERSTRVEDTAVAVRLVGAAGGLTREVKSKRPQTKR